VVVGVGVVVVVVVAPEDRQTVPGSATTSPHHKSLDPAHAGRHNVAAAAALANIHAQNQ